MFALNDPSPNRVAFDLERVMCTRYRIDDFQETYFVLDNLDALLELARIDFAPIYERLDGRGEFGPGDLSPTDSVHSRGSGRHHAAPRAAG